MPQPLPPPPQAGRTPVRRQVPARPAWGPRLDRWALRAARWLGRLLPPPADADLEALARPDRGPRPPPTPPPVDLGRARAALARGEAAEALHLFGVLLEREPGEAWAWHGRGDALLALGDPAGALAAYARAEALAPAEGLHAAGQSNALEALGRLPEARVAWDRAMARDPGLAWVRRGRPPRP